MTNIAVFLNGPVKYDSRVKKTINSLAKNADVYVFYIQGEKNDAELFPDNVTVYSVLPKQPKKAYLLRHSLFVFEFSYLARKALAIKVPFHYVWANDLPACYPAYNVAKKYNATFVYDSHEIYLETLNQFYLSSANKLKNILFNLSLSVMKWSGKYYEKRVFRHLDTFVTVNESLLAYYNTNYPKLSSKKTCVVMNCPPLEFSTTKKANKITKETEWKMDDKILLYQGVLNSGRGLMLILETLKHLPETYKFLVIGDGILRKSMETYIAKHNLNHRVHLLGYINEEDFMHYTPYATMGINLLEDLNLSKSLASPNKLFQYIHADLPSINSNTIENKRLIDKYPIGLLTENNVASVKKAICSLEKMEFNKTIFEKAKQEYSWENQEIVILNDIVNEK